MTIVIIDALQIVEKFNGLLFQELLDLRALPGEKIINDTGMKEHNNEHRVLSWKV